MKIDKGLEKFRQNKVLSFEHGRHLVLMQETFRLRCKALLKRQGNGQAA